AFDAMWFDETGSGLALLDGNFSTPSSAPVYVNLPLPLPQDPSALVSQAVNIPVLGASPTPFHLLAPHQDAQFIGDRPFFYMGVQRTFVVSSTGNSRRLMNPATWVVADPAALGLATSAPVPAGAPTNPAPITSAGLTVLVPNVQGVRIA